MDTNELEKLVAEIGEAILHQMRPAPPPASCCVVVPGAGARSAQTVAAMIDHTILRPEATDAHVRQVCREAREYGFASVCVNAWWVPLVARELAGTGVKACAVSGFPLGMAPTGAKVVEAQTAVGNGANEVDMVLAIGALKSGDHTGVRNDIAAVAEACHHGGALLKVIIEACLLTKEEKETACLLCVEAGADFVKTSTGFSKHGATKEDVALMRRVVGPSIGVKAAGGIRTLDDFETMVAAGANRVGASASVQIVEAAKARR